MSTEGPEQWKGLMRLMGRSESGKTGGEIRRRQQQVAAETLGKSSSGGPREDVFVSVAQTI